MSRAMRQPGVPEIVATPRPRVNAAVLPVKLNIGGQRSRWITTVTTFGAPQDAFVEELTIEQFYPAAS